MHKNATKCNETLGKWCKNNHGAWKIMDTLETYHPSQLFCLLVYSKLNAHLAPLSKSFSLVSTFLPPLNFGPGSATVFELASTTLCIPCEGMDIQRVCILGKEAPISSNSPVPLVTWFLTPDHAAAGLHRHGSSAAILWWHSSRLCAAAAIPPQHAYALVQPAAVPSSSSTTTFIK
jgi:hypothetical protein